MTKPQQSNLQRRAPIGRRPGADPASAWVQQVDAVMAAAKASVYTARLTIDVTPVMRGRIKVEIGLAKGKKQHDKREAEKERDWDREKARLMRVKA